MAKTAVVKPPPSARVVTPVAPATAPVAMVPPPPSVTVGALVYPLRGFRLTESRGDRGRPSTGPRCKKCSSETVRRRRLKCNRPLFERIAFVCSNAKCRETVEVERRV